MSDSEEREWHAVCDVSDIDDGSAAVVTVEGDDVAVFRVGEDVFALGNVCPHRGGPLGDGRVEDGCVRCPWHGWEFDLETGEHVHERGQADTYATRVEDGEVHVER